MPKGLWVVATPLGNLMDASDRMRQALTEADTILCEDTRRTKALLQALGISNRTVRFDAHVENRKSDDSPSSTTEWILEELSHGKSLALVTDAGTPGIADPGARLVDAVHRAGVRVTPIPGPSAVVTLLSVAGFPEASFAFLGFFPRTDTERTTSLAHLGPGSVTVWYESPQRICELLQALTESPWSALPDTQVCAGKEITKIHERLFRGHPSEVLRAVQDHVAREGTVGEWTVALHLPPRASPAEVSTGPEAWEMALESCLESGATVSNAVKVICQKFGVRKNLVYDSAIKKSKK